MNRYFDWPQLDFPQILMVFWRGWFGNASAHIYHQPATHCIIKRLIEKLGKWSLLKAFVLFNDLIVIGATQMLVIVKVTIKARRGFDRQTQVALGVAPGQLLIGHYRNVADAISGSDARQLAGAELTWRSL